MITEDAEKKDDLLTLEEAVTMAVKLHQNGRISESEAIYKSIIAVEPEHAEALHFLGLLSFQNSNTREAIKLLNRSLLSSPSYTDARNNLGNMYRTIGDYPAATASYRQVVEYNPNHPEAWNNLGGVLLNQRKLQESLQSYTRACELSPDTADFHYNRGHALHNCQRWEDAQSAYRKAIELNPNHAAAYRELGSILQAMDQPDEAMECFKKSTEMDSERGEAHCAHGDALSGQGLLPDAVLAYRRAIVVEPEYCRSYAHAAHALIKLGELKEAKEMVEKWQILEPNNASAGHMLASISADTALSRASDDYVEEHFDEFSKQFDSRLAMLQYKAPELLCNLAVDRNILSPAAKITILDAGCGTGLCGPLLKPYSSTLIGIDLSNGMLDCARERGDHYAELVHGEITEYLQQTKQQFDLIISADTLVYFGDLQEVISASARCLVNHGWLLFSVEKLGQDNSKKQYRLNTNGRFSHTYEYLEQTVAKNGFRLESITDVVLRQELGKPVNGYLVLGQKI